MSDIDTSAADSLKVLDPERPIREADVLGRWVATATVEASDPRRGFRILTEEVKLAE